MLFEGDGGPRSVSLEYTDAEYQEIGHAGGVYSRERLLRLADSGRLLVTLTARLVLGHVNAGDNASLASSSHLWQ